MELTVLTISTLSFLIGQLQSAVQVHAYLRVSSKSVRDVSNIAKAGLAWPNGPDANIDQYTTTGKVQWYYTWSSDGFNSDLEFVPMLWGPTYTDHWNASIDNTIQSLHVSHILGFNEPQETSQSNISPNEGASLWKQYIEPLKGQGLHLGSPAPSSAPSGKTWLQEFFDACAGGCTVDFIALHWYDINSTAFIEYLQDFHDTFQRPLWITEWACENFNGNCQCSQQDVVNFMNATQEFMDSTDWIERYAWFGAFEDLQGVNPDDALMDSSGNINALGQQYIGAVTSSVRSDYEPGILHGNNCNNTASPTVSFATASCSCIHGIHWAIVSIVSSLMVYGF